MRDEWDRIQVTGSASLDLTDRGLTFNGETMEGLTHVAGLDLSFFKACPSQAVACVVIMRFPSLVIEESRTDLVTLDIPYVSSYLAFREAPPLLQVFRSMRLRDKVQLILVDGNGTLHPRRFGLACHIGLELGVPSVGVAKSYLRIGGLPSEDQIRANHQNVDGHFHYALEDYGAAVWPRPCILKPVFVSPGNHISMGSAVRSVVECSRFRVPEPVRCADILGRKRAREIESKRNGVGDKSLDIPVAPTL